MNPNLNRPINFSFYLPAMLSFLILAIGVGCDGYHNAQSTEEGQANLTLETIPEDVTCIRVTVVGEFRTAVRDFDVLPGATFSQALTGLPVGEVIFTANAYAAECTGLTKSTAPMWLSEEKTVNLIQGKSSSVTLILMKNGRAKVSVEFADQEDGGTDSGVPDSGA
jgi:hypothetical protein